MSRKKSSARPNIPQETLDRARQAASRNGFQVEPAEAASRSVAPRARVQPVTKAATMEDLLAEYSYVTTDLRNMALLAAALFAFLIVLAVIL